MKINIHERLKILNSLGLHSNGVYFINNDNDNDIIVYYTELAFEDDLIWEDIIYKTRIKIRNKTLKKLDI